MEIYIEKSKNGLDTCKIMHGEKWRYIYSKYAPERINTITINPAVEFVIVFGAGLGYELEYYLKNLHIPIVVIESEQIFREYIQSKLQLNTISLEQFEKLDFTKTYQVIEHHHLIGLNPSYYRAFKNVIHRQITTRPVIYLMEHGSLLRDCQQAFENLNYETKILPWSHVATIKKEIMTSNARYVFSINFSLNLAKICEELQIPYISWTVDTPSYSLFSEQIYKYQYSYKFVYDEEIVELLKGKQVRKIYYLPVAANLSRYSEIKLIDKEVVTYSVDVSFLGNSCGHNEYLNVFKKHLTPELQATIDTVVQKQLFTDESIIQNEINNLLVTQFERETGYALWKSSEPLLTKERRLAYLLGRYHSYVERTTLVKELGQDFSLKVYGDEYWMSDAKINNLQVYQGKAENFVEMPKIFKASKISINNIRCFVESGLPQRVFDVLACGSFLVTNNKKDIQRYFKNNRDLVIYRDLKDLKDIICHYLEHEEERKQIAMQGLQAVQEHTFEKRIAHILTVVDC